uniref:Thiol:disulfide interchange protein n=1 Tax=Caloglossa intermedia TaxID=100879 RepID=A0A1Z1M5U8_9FLOR|nr:thiol:disulfide interchange protein [Caloglossa intermedia]ARW61376.1 thiol:disulfide interchange protein [Caloglossa intermedia]
MLLNNFLSYFETALYNLQHRIAFLLLQKTDIFQANIFFLFFFAGIITVLNPCFVSIIPIGISYLNNYRLQVYKNIFALGLITSILVTILIISFFSYNYFLYLTHIPFLSLTVLIVLSLNLLQVLNFSYYLSTPSNNMNRIVNKSGVFLQCYFSGFIIGFTTVPCSSPIFTIMHFLLYNSSKIFVSLTYLTAYFFGCLLPLFIILYVFINYVHVRALAYLSSIIVPLVGFSTLTFSLFFLLEKILL